MQIEPAKEVKTENAFDQTVETERKSLHDVEALRTCSNFGIDIQIRGEFSERLKEHVRTGFHCQ